MNDFLKTLEEKTTGSPYNSVETLKQHNIDSLERLYEVLSDQSADDDLKIAAMVALLAVSNLVDKRRAIPAIWKLFTSSTDEKIRWHSLHAIGSLGSRRYTFKLLEIARNPQENHADRIMALVALRNTGDKRAIPGLRTIFHDQTQNMEVRTEAIEAVSYITDDTLLDDYIQLLQNSSPDIRFWAGYALAVARYDITPALEALDHVASFDHTTPESWGWHVDREALLPLERIYLEKSTGEQHPYGINMKLISPAPEYWTFSQHYREWHEGGKYTPKETPPITLSIDPDWLAAKLREQWPEIDLDVREPRPQTYLLDWRLPDLIGGLHRDRYAVVVTATNETTSMEFAKWYRSIIPAEHKLYRYDWADEGIHV